MSDDGAHFGIGAEAAMRAAIAGDEPEHVETAAEMKSRILATTIADANSYDGCATYVAKLILLAMIGNPSLAQEPTENEYALDDDGRLRISAEGGLILTRPGLWALIKPTLSTEDYEAVSGMTGFMWGWAVNAARRCVELPPVPNPAIITIG